MNVPTDDDTVRAAAAAIAATLTAALDDPASRTITLTRDEALLALGLVDGIVDHLDWDIVRQKGMLR